MDALVLPSRSFESIINAKILQMNGYDVIGASSTNDENLGGNFKKIVKIPYVYDSFFDDFILDFLQKNKFKIIVACHNVIYSHLTELFDARKIDIKLVKSLFGIYGFEGSYLDLLSDFYDQSDFLGTIIPKKTYQSLLSKAFSIHGQSNIEKLNTLIQIIPSLPPGDLVEIGSLEGRTAFLIGWLARKFKIGKLLCIDPWEESYALQNDSPSVLLNTTKRLNWDNIKNHFIFNLVDCFYEDLNYRIGTIDDIANKFGGPFSISTEEFGETKFSGFISFLHIDGNHDYEFVLNDINNCSEYIKEGGCIVFDDYEWNFGDGPKKVADEFCLKNKNKITKTIKSGGALFVLF